MRKNYLLEEATADEMYRAVAKIKSICLKTECSNCVFWNSVSQYCMFDVHLPVQWDVEEMEYRIGKYEYSKKRGADYE